MKTVIMADKSWLTFQLALTIAGGISSVNFRVLL